MSKKITKYLTVKLDKETKKPIGFLWQGNIEEINRETILGHIKKWNDAVAEGRHDFLYDLCDDEYIKSLLSDFQEIKVQRNIENLCDSIDELSEGIENIEYILKDIKRELERLKPEKKEEDE